MKKDCYGMDSEEGLMRAREAARQAGASIGSFVLSALEDYPISAGLVDQHIPKTRVQLCQTMVSEVSMPCPCSS